MMMGFPLLQSPGMLGGRRGTFSLMPSVTSTNGHKPAARDRLQYFKEYSKGRRADIRAKLVKWQGRKHRCPDCKGELTVGQMDGGLTKMCCPTTPADLAAARCPRWRQGKHYTLRYKE